MATARPFLRRGPSGPLADGGIRQVGYDEIVEALELPEDEAFVPRNQAGDPLRVVLPDVIPGNTIEVDWRMNFSSNPYYYMDPFAVTFAALITFDGSDPAIDPPTPQTLLLFNSGGSIRFPSAGQPDIFGANCDGLASAPIPEGATSATVQLLYDGGPLSFEIENDEEEPGEISDNAGTLKVSEIGVSSVTQPGPGFVVPADL